MLGASSYCQKVHALFFPHHYSLSRKWPGCVKGEVPDGVKNTQGLKALEGVEG